MSERGILKEVDGDADENEYALRPYGLLLMNLGSEDLARRACEALELHMRRHKRGIYVDDTGLHFGDGLDDEDFAVLIRATLWRDFTVDDLKAKAAKDLEDAVDAARHRTWQRRREEFEKQ